MKDSHLTLRISAALARTLDRLARDRGVPKSQVIREAVARYLAPEPEAVEARQRISAVELARRWESIPRLNPDEVEAFAGDIAEARTRLPAARAPWE